MESVAPLMSYIKLHSFWVMLMLQFIVYVNDFAQTFSENMKEKHVEGKQNE